MNSTCPTGTASNPDNVPSWIIPISSIVGFILGVITTIVPVLVIVCKTHYSNLKMKLQMKFDTVNRLEDVIIEKSIRNCQKERLKGKTRMTTANRNQNCNLDIAVLYTELSLQHVKSTVEKEGIPISLEGLINVIESKCNVLITGEGGLGKTTLLKKIAYTWANTTPEDKNNPISGKLLFLINMRDVEPSTDFKDKIMDEIMKQVDAEKIIVDHDLQDNSVKEFLIRHAAKIVILFDGYDELESDKRGNNNPINVFERNKWTDITVVLASRPIFAAHLRNSCEVHIEIKGFTPINRMKYIRKHFDFFEKNELGDSLIKTFKLTEEETRLFGGDHKEAFEMCSSPMLLIQICDIWEQKCRLPNDLSDLFKKVILCILNKYLIKIGTEQITEFDNICRHSIYFNALLSLGKVMYEGLKINKLRIEINDEMPDTPLSLALKLGFVYIDTSFDPQNKKQTYTPPHKLLSEALAGFYLSVKIKSIEAEYEEIRSNANLNMTRVFAIGFLGADAIILLKYWLESRTASHYYSVAQCLRHVQNKTYLLQELDKLMSNHQYFIEMCKSYKYFLNVANNGEHLFNLMITCINKYRDSPEIHELDLLRQAIKQKDFSQCCKMIVHISIIIQGLKADPTYIPWQSYYEHTGDGQAFEELLKYIARLNSIDLDKLSSEMDKVKLEYSHTSFDLGFTVDSAFFIHFLTRASNLHTLNIPGRYITAVVHNEVINKLHETGKILQLTELDLSGNDLNHIDDTFVMNLVAIAPKLKKLSMRNCSLSGKTLQALITKCNTHDVHLAGLRLDISKNDTDKETLSSILRMATGLHRLTMRECKLSKDNFSDYNFGISESDLKYLDLNNNDLSGVDGTSIAKLMKKLPQLISFDISNCNLSNEIVGKIVETCTEMNVHLDVLRMKGNNLSDINGSSLAELIIKYDETVNWSDDYSLTADNLTSLVDEPTNMTHFHCRNVNLSGIDLSKISGATLFGLFNSCKYLIHVDLRTFDSNCGLQAKAICEMIKKCRDNNVLLKDGMLDLMGNDLSEIDGDTLAELVGIIRLPTLLYTQGEQVFKWSEYYNLKADNLKSLVKASKHRMLGWKNVDFTGIQLDQISGETLFGLCKSSGDLIHVDLSTSGSNCCLQASAICKMIKKCRNNNVHLKDQMFNLKGNNLSEIDGHTHAELVRVIYYNCFEWSDYKLTAGNLTNLVKSLRGKMTLCWTMVDLSGTNLSSIENKTLIGLLKSSTNPIHIDMSNCSLTDEQKTVIEECRNQLKHTLKLVLNSKRPIDIKYTLESDTGRSDSSMERDPLVHDHHENESISKILKGP